MNSEPNMASPREAQIRSKKGTVFIVPNMLLASEDIKQKQNEESTVLLLYTYWKKDQI